MFMSVKARADRLPGRLPGFANLLAICPKTIGNPQCRTDCGGAGGIRTHVRFPVNAFRVTKIYNIDFLPEALS